MALNTVMPRDIKKTDALSEIPRDLLGPIPAEIRLGANVLMMMDDPPAAGDTITVTMRLKVKREAKDLGGEEDGELVHFRGCKIIAAWLKGDPEPPNTDEEQPALLADDGITPTDDEPEVLADAMDNVARPNFSHGEGGK
jgi:hypothetical protein